MLVVKLYCSELQILQQQEYTNSLLRKIHLVTLSTSKVFIADMSGVRQTTRFTKKMA